MFAIRKYAVCILITIGLIILEAIITFGMTAIGNVGENTIRHKADEGDKRALRLRDLLERLENYENFILSICTTINIAIGFFYSRRIIYWSSIGSTVVKDYQISSFLAKVFQLIGMVVLIFIVTVLGNALPRKLALRRSEEKAFQYVGVVALFVGSFGLFSRLVEITVYGLLRLTGKRMEEFEESVTEDEIISIVNEGLEQGVLEDNEVEMISNIIEMDEKEVRDVMTRRNQIVALDGNLSLEEAMEIMLEKSYSRFPVYEDTIDNVIGIVFWKDLTKYYIKSKNKKVLLRQMAKKAYLVPDTQKIDVLFEKMQLKKISMAIAIDEYGQTVGIVAMEDILEEIVGNIFDEFDEDERMIIKQRDGKFFMRGLAQLEDVANELEINLDEELQDYDTLNGLLISQLGHIPKEKEKINIIYKGYEFRVVDVHDRMIRFVRVHKEGISEA